jgi:tRNA uridine 5-carbamoylmethylation protein Kti12
MLYLSLSSPVSLVGVVIVVIVVELMRTALVVLLGLPGAGKSTLAAALAAALSTATVQTIEYDRIVAVRNVDDAESTTTSTWREQRAAATRACGECLRTWAATGEGGGDAVLLVDDNMYYRSMRRELWQTAVEGKWWTSWRTRMNRCRLGERG